MIWKVSEISGRKKVGKGLQKIIGEVKAKYKYSYDKQGFRGFTPNKKACIYKVRFLRWTSGTFQ